MEQDLRNFFHALQTLLRLVEEPQRRFEARYAPRFNPLDLIERERSLAEMLALLLDPQREHGQGRLFLDAFLDCLVRPNDGLDPPPLAGEVKVETEKTIDGARRLDILVSSSRPPGSALAIEVKVRAGEQRQQLEDYLDWLRRSFQHSTLVFVAPEWREPSIKEGVVKLPWTVEASDKTGSIVGWLTLCRERCRAERVRWFLDMLIERVETMTGQTTATPDPRSAIVESYIGASPDNLRLGAEIAKAFATL